MHKIFLFTYSILALSLSGFVLAESKPSPARLSSPQLATAIFAGGCFWCVEKDFEKLTGVIEVESGYTDGNVKNPTYKQVSNGSTGHAEAVRVLYDPKKVSYEKLVDYFWHHIDPTVKDQQFCDVGNQYRSAIFYQGESQKIIAEASKAALDKSGKLRYNYTQISPASTFYLAESYHQDYYKKNPIRYAYYRKSCGRDERVNEIWGSTK